MDVPPCCDLKLAARLRIFGQLVPFGDHAPDRHVGNPTGNPGFQVSNSLNILGVPNSDVINPYKSL